MHRLPSSLSLLRRLGLLLGMALAAVPATAAPPIEAPAEIRALIDTDPDLQAPMPAAEEERLGFIRRLRERLTELLATEGWFSPAIDLQAGEPPVLKITPGPRSLIADVDIEFRGHIAGGGATARMAALRQEWSLKPGQTFRQDAWTAAKDGLLQKLLAEDYPAARIASSVADVDAEHRQVHLKLTVDSGPAFTLGDLAITGLSSYPPDLVRRYSTLTPGERYSQERLLALQNALQNTPWFSSVQVDIEPDPAHAERVPVRISLSEAKPRNIRIGAGYSTNTGSRVELAYGDANFLGRAWNLSSALRVETTHQIAFADVVLPPADRNYRYSVGVLQEHSLIQELDTRRTAIGVRQTQVRSGIETRLDLNYQQETSRAGSDAPTRQNALTLNASWTRRDVDDILDPRRGNVVNVQVGGGSKAALSDQNFLRGYLHAQFWHPVGPRDSVSLRGEAGYTLAPGREGIPQDFLFRTGGAQSVRGYAYQSLGVSKAGAITGGRSLLVGSVEYTHWLGGHWGAAAFADTGDAADRWQDLRLVRSYGLGARWKSPAGPLALDLAWSERDRKLRPHFSLAIAF